MEMKKKRLHKDTIVIHEGYNDKTHQEVYRSRFIKHRHFRLKQQSRGKSIFRCRRREYLFETW